METATFSTNYQWNFPTFESHTTYEHLEIALHRPLAKPLNTFGAYLAQNKYWLATVLGEAGVIIAGLIYWYLRRR